MKKIKFLAAVLAVMTSFASCSKDNDGGGDNTSNDPKTVWVNFLKPNYDTRAETGAGADKITTPINDCNFYFTNASGVITAVYDYQGDVDYTTNKVVELTNVPNTSEYVYIVANIDNVSSTFPVIGANISTLKDVLVGVETQLDDTDPVDNITLYGASEQLEAHVTKPNVWVAEVTPTPIAARVEIAQFSLATGLEDYELEGIFINNYYVELGANGVLAAGMTKEDHGDEANDYTEGDGKYESSLSGAVYDFYSTPMAANIDVIAPATGVWGYNLMSTASDTEFPHIIVRVKKNGEDSKFVTVQQFIKKDESGTSEQVEFKPGYIYSISNFKINALGDKPYEVIESVEVTIKAFEWEKVEIEPVA